MNQNKSVSSLFARYVSNNILGMIGMSCYILADTYFVANGLGSSSLAALNLALPAYNFIFGMGALIGTGGATRFSICKGANDIKGQSNIFSNSMSLTLLVSIPFVILGLFFSGALAQLLGANGAVLSDTQGYLKIILIFAPLFLLENVIMSFVRNDGSPALAMAAMLTGSFSNIFLDYLFMYVFKMGIRGAALATVCAPFIGLCVLSVHFLRRKHTFALILAKLKPHRVVDITKLGSSAFVIELSGGVVMIALNYIILSLQGNLGVAAYGIVANIAIVSLSIFNGIAQGSQPLISQNYGAEKMDCANTVYKLGLKTSLVCGILIYGVCSIFASPLAGVFNNSNNIDLQNMAATGLRLYFLGFLIVGYNILTSTYLSSTDKPKPAFVITLLRGFILILPAAFIMAKSFGMIGVWLAFPLTELVCAAVSFFLYKGNKTCH